MIKKVKNLEQIKAKLDVHSTLEYLGVETQGQKMICCPLHGEQTPSFSIYDEDKKWTCFGECSTGGDSIRLVELYKGISWVDAVQEVGNLVGVQPEFSDMSIEELRELQSRGKIEKVLEGLNTYFKEKIWETAIDSDKAKGYLFDKRLISKELVPIYEIGYAPWDYTDFLIGLVENSDITLEELIEFKLLGSRDLERPDRTNVYCTLRNCITIPIIEGDKVVGFIGRNIDENTTYKYIKVGYTDYWDGIIWQNGERLDGQLEGDVLHIVEGQIDALTMIQCGIDNVWAVNGVNSLTQKVVNLVKKMNPDKIYVHLDSDDAGEKAQIKWAEKLGHKCYIVPSIYELKDNDGKEIEDINRLFTFLYEMEKANENSDEVSFRNAVEKVLKSLELRVKNAENLIDMEFNKWLSIEDEILRADRLESLLETVYRQYEGNPELIRLFYEKQLKPLKVSKGNFDKYIKKFDKEVDLVPYRHGQGLEIPEWEVIDGDLYKCIPTMYNGEYGYKPVMVTTTVPEISKILVNVNTNLSEIEITYKDKRGNLRRELLADISTRKGILDALRGKDFDVNESNIIDVMNYINYLDVQLGEEAEIENITERFGWHNDFKTFVIGRDVLGEPVVTFKGAGEGEEQVADGYITKGTLEDWKKLIPLTKGRHLLRFQLYTSFGTPLIPILGSGNFVFSNWGDSSAGKTTANKVAGSIWGNIYPNFGTPSTLVEGNRITLDKLEKSIYLRQDIPIFLQEANRARPNVMENRWDNSK